MVRVSTFCPRCGEAIETQVPDEAKVAGRAELACPACRFEFVIMPARRADEAPRPAPRPETPDPAGDAAPVAPEGPHRALEASRRPARAKVSFKPVAAAMMLFFVATLGLWQGSVVVFTDDLVETGFEGMEGEARFAGRVVGPDNEPLGGVLVERVTNATDPATDAGPWPNRTTGPDGRYVFTGMAPGVHTFRFSRANHTTVLLEVPAYPEDFGALFTDDAALGAVTMRPGDPADVREVSRLDQFERIAIGWGWFTLVMSVLALAGAWACLRRRGFALAIVGAVAGIATVGFLVGAAVSLLALVLIIVARREFGPLTTPKDARP